MAASNDSSFEAGDPRIDWPRKWSNGNLNIKLACGRGLAVCDLTSSDPFVKLAALDSDGNVMGAEWKSKVVKSSLDPIWNQVWPDLPQPTGEDFALDRVRVLVWDKDVIGKDDFMGEAYVSKDEILAVASSGYKPITVTLVGREGKKDSHVKGTVTLDVNYNVAELTEQLTKFRERQQALAAEKSAAEAEAKRIAYEESVARRKAEREAEKLAKEEEAGDQALYSAVLDDQLDDVRRLLAKGLDCNVKSRFSGKSALSVAFTRGKPEIAKLLIDAGATTHCGLYQIASATEDYNTKKALVELALSTPGGREEKMLEEAAAAAHAEKKDADRMHRFLLAGGTEEEWNRKK